MLERVQVDRERLPAGGQCPGSVCSGQGGTRKKQQREAHLEMGIGAGGPQVVGPICGLAGVRVDLAAQSQTA